jgi:alpha-tubulin suppressor-like RCC1 family protein
MAGVKISALTTSATFSDTDVLPLVSGGVTKKVTGAVVKAAIGVPPAGSVGTTQLANGSVTTPKLAAGAVDAAAIGTSAVETAKINDSAVTTAKIANDNVTSAKLASTVRADIARGSQARSGTTIPTTGSVKGVVVLAGGSGYTSGVTVSIAAPPSGVTATATATVVGNSVTAITITDGGSGYTDQNPTVTITAVGAGSGASAVAYAMVQPLLVDDGMRTRGGGYQFYSISSNDDILVAGNNYNYCLATGSDNNDALNPINIPIVDYSGNKLKPISIYTSSESVYVLCADGSLWSAGYNGYGQLGRGFTGVITNYAQNSTVFEKITFSGGGVVKKFATSFSSGSDRTTCLALVETSGGSQTLYGWGYNGHSQLGNGGTSDANTPQILSCSDGAATITDIAVIGVNQYSVCVVLFSSGRAKAAGYNGHAQLSRGDTLAKTTFDFVNVSSGTPLTNIVEIAGIDCNYPAIFYRTSGGLIYSVGYENNGELGQGGGLSNSSTTYMAQVQGGAIFPTGSGRYIFGNGGYAAGHAFAFKADGSLVAWGYNGYRQLGLGTTTNAVSAPTAVPGGHTSSNVARLLTVGSWQASSVASSAILRTDGTIYATGYNGNSNLGIGNSAQPLSFLPVRIDKTIVKDITFIGKYSTTYSLAVHTTDGSLYTTGSNYAGMACRGYDASAVIATHVQARL